MSEEELSHYARLQHSATRQKLAIEKHVVFYRAMNRLAVGIYWEKEMRTLYDQQPPTIFVSSMSERHDSGAMWALYAQQHRGIVFGLSSAVDRLRGPVAFLEKVTYDERRPQMPTPIIVESVFREAIRTKSTDWSYQREWRLFAGSAVVEPLKMEEVAEIVIGYKAEDSIRDAAMAFKNSGTKVYRAYPDSMLHSISRQEL